MVRPKVQLTLGFVAAAALMAAAIWLWFHNVIIVAAPVGALALGCAWAGVDNALIYPAQRAQRQALLNPPAAGGPSDGPAPPESAPPSGVTAPH